MKLIAFLGNPGKKYKRTRHNAGFIFGELFSQEMKIKLNSKNFDSYSGRGPVNGADTAVLFPHTYMNNSGTAVAPAMKYFGCPLEDLIVVHDEIEMVFGAINVKKGGGHKGHNGLRSIIEHLKTADFIRLRFGVGRPEHPHETVADYLLNPFTKEQYAELENFYPLIRENLVRLITPLEGDEKP